jgi:hypothetical protein
MVQALDLHEDIRSGRNRTTRFRIVQLPGVPERDDPESAREGPAQLLCDLLRRKATRLQDDDCRSGIK